MDLGFPGADLRSRRDPWALQSPRLGAAECSSLRLRVQVFFLSKALFGSEGFGFRDEGLGWVRV